MPSIGELSSTSFRAAWAVRDRYEFLELQAVITPYPCLPPKLGCLEILRAALSPREPGPILFSTPGTISALPGL